MQDKFGPGPNAGNRFTIRRNRKGCWLVCDTLGLIGGIFVDKASAIRFARTESCDRSDRFYWGRGKQSLEVKDLFNVGSTRRHPARVQFRSQN